MPDPMMQTMYNFFAPIIGYKGAEDTIRPHHLEIKARRVEESMKSEARTRASDLEVFYYLQSSTLVQPPGEEMYNAIAYLCEQEFPDIHKISGFPHIDLSTKPDVKSLIDKLGTQIYRDQMKELRKKVTK